MGDGPSWTFLSIFVFLPILAILVAILALDGSLLLIIISIMWAVLGLMVGASSFENRPGSSRGGSS